MSTSDEMANAVDELVDQIRPLLAGKGSAVQSAVLADLVSMWLAGHLSMRREDTPALREQLLDEFVGLVRSLTPVNAAMLLDRMAKGTKQ